MKRSRIDAGQKSRDRGSTFAAPRKQLERKSSLERVSSLKSTTDGKGKGRKQIIEREREAKAAWFASVKAPCVMCAGKVDAVPAKVWRSHGPELRILEAHHAIPKRTLRVERLDAHLWAPGNAVCLCRYHHARHEQHVQRLPRSLLPAAVFEFAAELALEAILDREYPATVTNERRAA